MSGSDLLGRSLGPPLPAPSVQAPPLNPRPVRPAGLVTTIPLLVHLERFARGAISL